MDWSIGIDIGGTNIAGGIVHRFGNLHKQIVVATPLQGQEAILAAVLDVVTQLQNQAKADKLKVCGIGIGSAGAVDYSQGIIRNAGNLNGWRNVPLKQIVSQHSSLPVWVDHDASVMALGELKYGSAIGNEDVVCLTLGTGVGGAVIKGGQLLRGRRSSTGEFGHVTTNLHGPKCTCGSRGCLQLYASGKGLTERWKEQGLASGEKLSSATAKDIFAYRREGHRIAEHIIEEMLQALSYSLINLIYIFNPSLVILGGRLIEHESWICQEVEKRIKRQGLISYVDEVVVSPAQLGSRAGLIGAASIPFQHRA